MGSVFLLSEEKQQVPFETKVKYLYTSEFNRLLSSHLDSEGVEYYYLSLSHGVLLPNEVVAPYPIRLLDKESVTLWSVLSYYMLMNNFEDKKVDRICLLYSGNSYNKLEDLLSKSYMVESPLKNFIKGDVLTRWANDIIVSSILSKLSFNLRKDDFNGYGAKEFNYKNVFGQLL